MSPTKEAFQPPEGYMLVPLEPPYRPKYIATGTLVEGKKRTKVYLTWTEEGGGWYQWCTSKSWANLFSSEESAMRNAKACPGPSFLMPSPGTITIEKVHGPKALAYLDMLSHVRTKGATQ